MHARTTRPIMRTVQSAASLHDATVVLDDRVILRAVTVAIDPGVTLVRGPNGSGKTPLLLLDEPFADLDDAGVDRLRQAITRARNDGRAIVVATHAHRELDGFARAQIALDDGAATAS